MGDKGKFQAIKGVRDILPPESALWNRVEQTARETFGTFGFAEIRLPIFEQTELFARSVGQETDIVSKEMYSFEDRAQGVITAMKDAIQMAMVSPDSPDSINVFTATLKRYETLVTTGISSAEIPNSAAIQVYAAGLRHGLEILERFQRDPENKWLESIGFSGFSAIIAGIKALAFAIPMGENIALRPEATASVVRAYIEHGMQMLPGNAKLYYTGPMFRRERPQKGRYRQFYQIGAEVLGSSDAPGIDAEVIEMLMRLFERLKLKGAILNVNSIGCKNCRPAYVEVLRAELLKVREQLGEDSKRRIETNPLRVLDSKLEHEQAIIATLPRIADHLCNDCRVHYDEVKRQLGLRGITYQENWRLVRGLDYYMRTTFEITAPGLGSQNAVCGGGRYDGLVELLGGPATTKGIGFAIGTDRLILSLQEAGEGATPSGYDVYLAWFGAAAQTAAIGLAHRLRDAGFTVELPAAEMKFGKSLGLADRLKARHAVIMGDDELAAGVVTVKRLTDSSQQKLAEQDLFSYLRSQNPK
ncbi:MAG TPA: histidine--tRNA ligase [Candidatus Acidoferrales bacterium]|nr:histidine--tRNA ligase [Candidatus Acidoferrales bacterium]